MLKLKDQSLEIKVKSSKFMKDLKIMSSDLKDRQNLRSSLSRESSGFAVISTAVCT